MDWTLKMQELNKKIAKMNTVLAKDAFSVGLCVINDYECSKQLMEINEQDWEKILNELYKSDKKQLAQKVEIVVCYIAELKRLASINLKELVGLTRDDVTAIQRVCATRKDATSRTTRTKTLETLMRLVDLATEAEANDRLLQQKAEIYSKHAY
jgi:hypothetical protein